MRLPLLRKLLVFSLLAAARLHGQVVVNEIMYRPGTGFPENTGLEFIELHNPTATAVDVSGWALTSGVPYTIPAATTIAAGGFLVIASDPAQVQAAYGISGVLGPWAAGSSLSGKGEKITLSKPGPTPGTFVKVDDVTYASEGDWGTRFRESTFGGWDWSTPANGGGKSTELRNPAVSNDNGQNWAPSTAAAGATPGSANSVLTTNLAPIIHGVTHFPAIPKSVESVTISCQVNDETAASGLTATLFWRDATSTTPGAFQSTPMAGDGAGNFAAVLDPKANLTIVEFYVSASDGVNTRTWPAPTTEGQNANCQYQVDNEVLNATDSYYRLVLTGAENAAFNNTATNNSGSDRQFNQTLVVARGADTTIRYRSGMRIRGNSSRSYTFKPLRIIIPNDDLWDGAAVFNLNPKASFLQFFGSRAFQAAGIRAGDSVPVELRRNGVESTTSTGTTPDYGKWTRLEDENGDLVNTHWPASNSGNLYKKVDNGGGLNFYWRTGQAAPASPDALLDGWSKQNNSTANDWSDLTNFFAVWQAAARPHFPGSTANDVSESNASRISGIGKWNGTAFTSPEITSIEAFADLDQWARWFAVMTIIQDLETKISNGVDDDYAAYFVPVAGGQRKMQLLAHDLDTILGLGDDPQAFNYTGLYDMTEGGQSGYTFRALLPLFGTTTVAGNAAFRTKYHDAIRELYGTVFNADTTGNPNPPFYQFLDNHLAGWVPAGVRTSMKTFATARQTHLLGLIGSGAIVPPAPTSTPTFTNAAGSLMIHEILADNRTTLNVAGSFPDIIELRNNGATAASLSGMSLTDDPALKDKFVFPIGTTIAAGGYLIVYADIGSGGGLHTGFGLNADGDLVQLYGTIGLGQPLVDSIAFGAQAPDFSIGRTGATLETWTLCTPTIGAANTPVATLAGPAGITINEWLGNPDYQWDDDFLELYNSAAQPVAIGGMTVTNDFINYPALRTLPALSFIAPASFLRMDGKGSTATPGNAGELPFKINGLASWLALIGQNGSFVDRVDVVSQPADGSTGRAPDGSATFANFGLPGGLPSPGASNVTPPANILALMNGLRVTELLYTPGNLEYIELQNTSATTLDLAGVHFTKGVNYTFGAGVTLAPGAFVVVCANRSAFLAQFGGGVPLAAGNFTGSLDNAGETIAFRPPAPWEPNILNFTYYATWYPATSSGYSLAVVDAASAPGDWGKKTNWRASPALYGSPGNDGPPFITSTLTAGSVVGDAFSYQITASKFPTSYAAAPLPPGLGVNTSTGLISGTPSVAGTFSCSITATNGAGSDTRELVFTIADSGPLAGFAWDTVASPQQAGVPFMGKVRAVDSSGRTVTSFNGTANLTGGSFGMPGSTVVVTEFSVASLDYFELQNVSASAVNTNGWFVIVNDSTNVPANAATDVKVRHGTVWPLPASMTSGQVIYATESATENPFGEPINWFTINGTSWVMLVDNAGVIRDFVASGYTAAQIATISVTANGFTLSPGAQWSGNGVSGINALTPTGVRGGSSDHQNATDWSTTISTSGRGVQNSGLSLGSSVTVSPAATGSFVNGVWTGSVTVAQVATALRLTATDSASHSGQSNNFDTTLPAAPVITSPASAIAVVGKPFSYQIVTTNYAASFTATNLPANLTIDTATGLITGTPAASATSSLSLSATNLGGTGNATLSLQVQADADADGMGDAWESANGLNPAVNDSALDRDGDGQSNLAEWLAGTLPNNPASRLAITSEQAIGADLKLTWTSTIGRRYRVFTRPVLNTGSWSEITSAPITATTTSATFTHTSGATGAQRFYRVSIEP